MFRFIFVLLILNASYRGLGGPVPTTTTTSLESLLAALAKSCENVFLSNHIKSQIDVCSGSQRGKTQLECLMFYDINTQLCAAVGDSKLTVKEDFTDKIDKEQDVQVVCDNTKDWVFTNITEFPDYIHSVKKIFKHPVPCGKMCGSDNLLSDDTTYVCKYFKWGAESLKQQVTIAPTKEISLQQEITNTANKPVMPSSNELQDVEVKSAVSTKSEIVPLELAEVKADEADKTEVVKQEASSEHNQEPSSVDTNVENPAVPKEVNEEPIAENPPVASELTDNQLVAEPKNNENKPHSEKPQPSLNKPDLNLPTLDDKKNEKPLSGPKELTIEDAGAGQPKAKDPSDDDYQDSDDGKDGLGDIQGDDDSDDPIIEDQNKISKLEAQEKNRASQSAVKSISPDITSAERIPGVYGAFPEDTYSDDDDDHFFSFFLTAVILVVVIYILYHNKNKVVKVFFGLILEGRQSGRRRNSRGHAYRRLDTLEQAMSTNSAAPPSKIIY